MKTVLPIVTVILALIGLGDSVFLSLDYLLRSPPKETLTASACDLVGGACESIAEDSHAFAFGIPTALIGAAYYLFVLTVALIRVRTGVWPLRSVLPVVLAAALIYSGYLVYVMVAYVGICPYCLAAHATNTVVVILYLFSRWLDMAQSYRSSRLSR
jgi:uncharacterized membrane protein